MEPLVKFIRQALPPDRPHDREACATLAWSLFRGLNPQEEFDGASLEAHLQRIAATDLAVAAEGLRGDESAWRAIMAVIESLRRRCRKSPELFDEQDVDNLHSHLISEAPSLKNTPNLKMRLATYSGRSSLYAWLCAIVVRQAISRRRRESKQAQLEYPEQVTDISTGPTDYNHEVRNRVQLAIETLSPQEQLVARMHWLEEMKGIDIAKRIHRTPSRVSQIIQEVSAKLRVQLTGLLD